MNEPTARDVLAAHVLAKGHEVERGEPATTTNPYENDIPTSVAKAAHSGTSWTPEVRAEQEHKGYAETLERDHANLLALATTDEKRAVLEAEFARYRDGYRTRVLKWLGSRSRCLSAAITGGSNFPARRNEKRNAVADKRCAELVEFRTRALAAVRRALTPELAPIMSGDADAGERLADKIAKAEQRQAHMKAVNATLRKHARAGVEAQVAALVALGVSESLAREHVKPDFLGRIGFADYEVRNNNANIRRLKGRLTGVEVLKATPETTTEGSAARVEDCPAENRVRLFFPGKPEKAVRERLKRGGFRWAPSLGAWQAYRNTGALVLAKEVAS